MKPILFTNAKVIAPDGLVEPGFVKVAGGLIEAVGTMKHAPTEGDIQVIDLKGAYLSPGFIDLHLHGAWGGDVMRGTIGDLRRMAAGLVKGGVTAFVPTTLTGTLAQIETVVDCIDQAVHTDLGGARVLGAHLEGPYFNPSQKGAQNPEYIILPKPDDYLPLLERSDCIKRISAAPELPGALELGQELKNRGIIASIAHSDATYQQVVQAISSGYTHVTHIYSGMSSVHRIDAYRIAGVVEATLLIDGLTTEMIGDGHHLPPSLMQLILKAKGLERVCLVTDAMSAAGLGPGQYDLGGLEVVVEADIPKEFEIPTEPRNYVAKLSDRSAFASSVATMDQMIRNMVKYVGLSICEAVKLATLNPARIQGIECQYGMIHPGMTADLAVFNEDIEILMTMVNGKVCYQK
jgi:N-acetylglucosamine-6-phosphate deacetylase